MSTLESQGTYVRLYGEQALHEMRMRTEPDYADMHCDGCGMCDPCGEHYEDCTLLEPGDILISRA
jgi:hypothetical protein